MLQIVKPTEDATTQRVVNVLFVWPCFNCRGMMPVDAPVHQLLKTGQLTGISCGSCLTPPTSGMLERVA